VNPALRWTARDTAWLAVLAPYFIALSAGLVWHQPLEKDEGYLSGTSWLVAGGRLPYVDFVLPQQPYFPLTYGVLLRWTGPSLLAARGLSAALFFLLGSLVFVFLLRGSGSPTLARWGAATFCFNTLTLYWYPRCRQYVLTDLLLFAAFFLVADEQGPSPARRRLRALAMAGAAAGAAMHTRLLVAPAVVVLAVAAARAGGSAWSWRRVGAFGLGGLAASVPFLWLFALGPSEWAFNTYSLQVLLRPPFETSHAFSRVTWALGRFFSVPIPLGLGLLCTWGILSRRARAWTLPAPGLAWGMTAAVGVSALLCYPTQDQYLVQILPYLVVVAMGPWGRWMSRLSGDRRPPVRAVPALLLILAVGAGSGRAVRRIASDQHHDPRLGVADLMAYQEFMARQGGHQEGTLLTWWPGHLLVPGVRPYPGSELGRPSERAVGRLSKGAFPIHGLRHPEQIEADLRAGVPRWVVVDAQAPVGVAKVLAARYCRVARFGLIEVYARRDGDG